MLTQCPYCNSSNIKRLNTIRELIVVSPLEYDNPYNGASATVESAICLDCHIGFNLNSLPQDLIDYACKTGFLGAYAGIGVNHYTKITEYIEKYLKKDDAIVEIGSRSGNLLKLLEQKGYTNLTGYDPGAEFTSTEHITACKDFYTYDIKFNPKLDGFILQSSVDIFTDLNAIFENLRDNLKEGGYIIFEVPSSKIALATQNYRIPLSAFDRLACDHGFNMIEGYEAKDNSEFNRAVFVKLKAGEAHVPFFSQEEAQKDLERTIAGLNSHPISLENQIKIKDFIENHQKDQIVLWGTGSTTFRMLDTVDHELLSRIDFYVVDGHEDRKGKTYVSPCKTKFTVNSVNSLKDKEIDALIICASHEFTNEILERIKQLNCKVKDLFYI
ncbi:Uncharacterised protein [Anaerobiospirillum thomasii]|uniref:methyltransferase domain-containing protein n=1 Tax=Anaerobiospirillum thomasii TaxID=179995 RepID=UPI000DA0B02D|nr:methyltransferase domain-containing protein [Anaerobiospirillum thomasii]SPT71914.1 Uncharacterised protein [Anaerobiospirillum thomasii]